MKIALTGGMYSGKTTLARYLQGRGYHLINFTDLLKRRSVDALRACGVPITIEDILKEKARYRPFLQELGKIIGFNDDPRYVMEACEGWLEAGQPPNVVFDNVRTRAQWAVLEVMGFVLVEVRVDWETQKSRAATWGVTGADLERVVKHPIEGMLRGAVVLDGACDASRNFYNLQERGIEDGEQIHSAGIYRTTLNHQTHK